MTAAARPAPAPVRHAVGQGALWFGLFGAPAAWAVQELAGYALVVHACFPAATPLRAPAAGDAWIVTLVIDSALLVVGAAAGLTAHRSWRRTGPGRPRAEERESEVTEGRTHFMAFSGLLLSAVFLFGLAMNLAVLFLIPLCG